MTTPENIEMPTGIRYLREAYACTKFPDRTLRLHAWSTIENAVHGSLDSESKQVIANIASYRKSERHNILKPGAFVDFVVLVGEQGSGKATMAREFARRQYAELTMSDVVRSVAPALGYSPDTTQGKIDAGHAMRRLFGGSILMKLCMFDAAHRAKDRIIVDGPRSMYEVRAARIAGARIIGLVADTNRKIDRDIRFERVVTLRPMSEPERRVEPEDFYSRERQERARSQRMLGVADITVVTNRKAADLVDALMPHSS